jgi:ribose/xylose/arabinose/galactoside ABC-type transport system permease subunit
MNSARTTTSSALHLQESGLVLIIFMLGAILSVFGGSVEREIGYRTTATGESIAITRKENKFLNAQNLAQLAKDTSFIAIMAVGATFVIIAGGIDLSVGSIFALASVLGAMVLHKFGPEVLGDQTTTAPQIFLAAATCVAVATLCGLANGAMIVTLKVHPFIITLGTMAIFRGIAFVKTSGQSIGGFPQEFRDFVRLEIGDGLRVVPPLGMVLVGIVGAIYLSKTTFGRRIYAVGGNELASRYSGVRVERVKLSVYILAGFTAGVAALLSLGYYGGATSGDGQGYELKVIAASVVGGASLSGGKGSVLGALLGALLIQMIDTGIVILRIDQNYSQIIIGSVVILAVVLDQFNNWLSKRRLLKA